MISPSLLSRTPSTLTSSVPAAVAVTRGAVGTSGVELPPLIANRVMPCWACWFTVLKSPPVKMLLPSVAMTCGPTVVLVPGLPPLVVGLQCPSLPSDSRWTWRRYQMKLSALFGPT